VFEFAVSDTGIGISEQQANNLFRPFMQGDKFIARKFGGSGLGLALSKQLAQLLGGDLVLTKTAIGSGSTFTISIEPGPLRGVRLTDEIIPIVEPQGDVRKQGKRLIGARVLLVEDGLDNQIIFKEFLRSEGAEVVGAEDGYKALDVCRGGREFDVVLMDIQMPGMDGYQTTRELRAMGIRRPIVALTAHAMKGERERCIEAGCDDFLTKPVNIDRLVSTVAKYWGGRPLPVATPPEDIAATHSSGKLLMNGVGTVQDGPLVSTLASDPRVQRVLGGFLERLPARVEKMQAACGASRWEELARDVHTLKGTAGNYGYPDMVQESKRIEELIRASGPDSEITAALMRLASLCQRARLAAAESLTS
jgi:CheY-like chemotaxis protein/HPt (histidine-containing phosphotransfer) domain-containing protein